MHKSPALVGEGHHQLHHSRRNVPDVTHATVVALDSGIALRHAAHFTGRERTT